MEKHINDESIHGKTNLTTTIINNYTTNISIGSEKYNINALTKDTIKYLPISYSVAALNKIIRDTPHNLNGFTLVFLFVVDEAYKDSKSNSYICEVGDSYIDFHNFYNGTLIITGDKIGSDGKIEHVKTEQQINNPILYDNLNVRKFIAEFEDELNNPCPINDIISYEETDERDSELNKIVIRGSGLNESFAALTMYDIQAKTYMKNLKFASSLSSIVSGSNTLDITYRYAALPSQDKLLLFYPFNKADKENELSAVIGDAFVSLLNNDANNEYITSANTSFNKALIAVNNLSSLLFNESTGLISYFQNSIDNYSNYSSDVQENLPLENLEYMKFQFSRLSNDFDAVLALKIGEDVKDYSYDGEFNEDELTSTFGNCAGTLSSLVDAIERTFSGSFFKIYLSYNPELVDNSVASLSATTDDYLSTYFEKYLNNDFNTINSTCSDLGIDATLIKDYKNLTPSDIQEYFDFRYVSDPESNPYWKAVSSNGNLSAIVLGSGLIDSSIEEVSSYLEFGGLSSTMCDDIMNLLFYHVNEWDLLDKHPTSGTALPLHSSRRGATMTFWVQLDEAANNSNLSFLKFEFENDAYISFENQSYKESNGNSKNYVHDGALSSLFNDNQWVMMEFRFDPLKKYSDKTYIDAYAYTKDINGEAVQTKLFSKPIEVSRYELRKCLQNHSW